MSTGYPGLAVALQQYLQNKAEAINPISAGVSLLSKIFEDEEGDTLDVPLGRLSGTAFVAKQVAGAANDAMVSTNLFRSLGEDQNKWRDTRPEAMRRNMEVISRANADTSKKLKPKRVPKVRKP